MTDDKNSNGENKHILLCETKFQSSQAIQTHPSAIKTLTQLFIQAKR